MTRGKSYSPNQIELPLQVQKDYTRMKALTDQSPMPFGKYKGQKMESVPAKYLLWLWNDGVQAGPVRDYIESNLSVLH